MGQCPLVLESWDLAVDARAASGNRVPLKLKAQLFNPAAGGQQVKLMLVSEDGDAAVSWNGFATTGEHLVIPAPTGSTVWSRPKLRVTIFSVILLGSERGELICSFRQPLAFQELLRSQLAFLTPRRQHWIRVSDGHLNLELPPSLQMRLKPEENYSPLKASCWPSSGNVNSLNLTVDSEEPEVRLDLRQLALPASLELLCVGLPGPILSCFLVLLIFPGRRGRWGTCAVGVVVSGVLTLACNYAFIRAVGWPDLAFRYDPGTWSQIFGCCTWAASPLVASLSVFFVWPLFEVAHTGDNQRE